MTVDGPGSATTGLSGDTYKGSAESVGRVSNGSKRSVTGKRRAGSTASSAQLQRIDTMAEKTSTLPEDGTTATNSPTSPLPKPKKSGGFCGLFSCFSSRKSGDDDTDPSKPAQGKRKDRVPVPGQAKEQTGAGTTSAEPNNLGQRQHSRDGQPILNEKASSSSGQNAATTDMPMQPDTRPGRRASKPEPRLETSGQGLSPNNAGGPHIAVIAPTPITPTNEQLIHDRSPEQEQRDTEIEMTDAGVTVPIASNEVAGYEDEATSSDSMNQPGNRDSKAKIDLPPPPPLQERQAQIAHHEGSPVRNGAEGQKWLLPPKRPEFKGKKCLVLDLDETLVHSSFKVTIPE
jgi:RNA polymerase II subunit A small phosphatase-like protein